MVNKETLTLEEAHLEFAKSSNGAVWTLLTKDKRSEAEDREMLTAAYASLYHWGQIGTGVNLQRGHWLISRVFSMLSQTELALLHAKLCMEYTEKAQDDLQDFDVAYAHEALARAHALDGNMELAKEYFDQASALGDLIEDEEDRQIFRDDLMSGILSDLS